MGLEQRWFDSKLILFTSQITQVWLQADLTDKMTEISGHLSRPETWVRKAEVDVVCVLIAQCKHGPFSGLDLRIASLLLTPPWEPQMRSRACIRLEP